MEIGRISLHKTINTNRTAEKKNVENKLSTNPFGVSFKGNVIQADVFETSKKSTEENGIAQRGKLFASAVVSGINNFNEAFKSRINSIVSFGKKVTSDVFTTLERIGNTEVRIDMEGIKNRLFPDRQYSVKNLSERSVDDLKNMWSELNTTEA